MLERRHVWPLLLSFHDSRMADHFTRGLVLQVCFTYYFYLDDSLHACIISSCLIDMMDANRSLVVVWHYHHH
jgi:hypothetical protein